MNERFRYYLKIVKTGWSHAASALTVIALTIFSGSLLDLIGINPWLAAAAVAVVVAYASLEGAYKISARFPSDEEQLAVELDVLDAQAQTLEARQHDASVADGEFNRWTIEVGKALDAPAGKPYRALFLNDTTMRPLGRPKTAFDDFERRHNRLEQMRRALRGTATPVLWMDTARLARDAVAWVNERPGYMFELGVVRNDGFVAARGCTVTIEAPGFDEADRGTTVIPAQTALAWTAGGNKIDIPPGEERSFPICAFDVGALRPTTILFTAERPRIELDRAHDCLFRISVSTADGQRLSESKWLYHTEGPVHGLGDSPVNRHDRPLRPLLEMMLTGLRNNRKSLEQAKELAGIPTFYRIAVEEVDQRISELAIGSRRPSLASDWEAAVAAQHPDTEAVPAFDFNGRGDEKAAARLWIELTRRIDAMGSLGYR